MLVGVAVNELKINYHHGHIYVYGSYCSFPTKELKLSSLPGTQSFGGRFSRRQASVFLCEGRLYTCGCIPEP